MFDELGAALAALSHDLPLVLILEDLQWADVDSINALARLAGSQIPSKLLIVGTCCNGEWTAGERARHRLTSAAATAPRSVTLALGCLTLEHVVRYIDVRFGPGCLSELAPAIHHATGGNPFMMVNAIDSLVSRRLVVAERGEWRREAPLDAIARALPETFGDVIARHVDHLDLSEREALEAAAVVGLEFTASSVAAALEQKVEYVRRVLGPLARRGHLIVAVAATGPSRAIADHLSLPPRPLRRHHRAAGADAAPAQSHRATESHSRHRRTRPHAPTRVRRPSLPALEPIAWTAGLVLERLYFWNGYMTFQSCFMSARIQPRLGASSRPRAS